MRARTLFAALVLLCGSVPVFARGPHRDATRELERLSSARSADREQAQTWLTVHLSPADRSAVAAAARTGDAETRRRLVGALAGADRHLELIVALCDETGESARTLGRDALTELARRWLPGLDRPPISTEDLLAQRAELPAAVFSLPARQSSIAERVEHIALETDLGLPIVVTPELLEQDRVALRPALEGTALELLDATVRSAGLSLAGVGDRDEEAGPALLVVDRRGRARRESAFERLEEWCLAVRRGGDDAERASLALASSGWPAALSWLEDRSLQDAPGGARDASLEGILAAARLGRVVPGLCRRDTRVRLLQLGDRRLASDDPRERRRGEGIAQAMAELGPRGLSGEDCGDVLLEGWNAESTDAQHWLRLVALEGQRTTDARVLQAAVRAAEGERHAAGVRLQALRAVAACGGAGVRFDDDGVRRVWTHAVANGGYDELLTLLGAVADPPSPARFDDARSFADPRYAAFVAGWALRCGDRDAVITAWRAAAEQGFENAARFDAWLAAADDARAVLGSQSARALLDEALGDARPRTATRFAIRADLLTAAESRTLALELAEQEQRTPDEWISLGCLAAGPASSTVRDSLVAGVGEATVGDARALAEACDAAASALRAERRDLELRRLSTQIWRAVRPPGHPLHDRLGPGSFPSRVELRATPLGYRLRRFTD